MRAALSDEDLMKALQDGDPTAIGELYDRHSSKIWTYLKKRLPKEHVDDIFQDCFIKIVERKSSWNGQPFVLWLYVITRNIVIDYYRELKLEQKIMEKINIDSDPYGGEKFEELISTLPPEVSRLVAEFFQEGWSYKELAEKYDSSEVTLRKRLSRALGLLKKGALNER